MRTRPITTALAALAFSGLLLGACGGGGDDDDAGPASIDEDAADDNDNDAGEGGSSRDGPTQEEQDAALEYAQCMRDHGVDIPDPEISDEGIGISIDGDQSGVSEEELRAAEEECKPILDEAMPEREPLDPEEIAERRDQALALAQCMRERDWDMPDPKVDDQGGIAVENPPDVGGPGDPRFEEFEADMRECEEEAGMPPPPGEEGELNESGSGGEEGGET